MISIEYRSLISRRLPWMSECSLAPTQLHHGENKLTFNEMTMLSWSFIVLAHWNNSNLFLPWYGSKIVELALNNDYVHLQVIRAHVVSNYYERTILMLVLQTLILQYHILTGTSGFTMNVPYSFWNFPLSTNTA